ncbi:MAG: alpha/beta hydrolase [Acidobacteria bacterium]|nr:alpha/beta hydrolase [Acidobacteriota bacterium]
MGRFLLASLILAMAGCTHREESTAIDRLQPCKSSDGPTDAYCGKLKVWENRQTKAGRQIDLNIVLLPALANESRPDPVFFLAGGPGQGAASHAKALKDTFRRVHHNRDLVLVDQRGTGKSNKLDCKYEPESLKDLDQSIEATNARLRGCLEKYEADTKLYTTTIAMDDLDDVRAHLGYSKINLYGGSYGTRAALVYLQRHQANARTVVLDGVAPQDMRLPLFMARDGQRALDRLSADCDADPACAAPYKGTSQRLQRLIARLKQAPVKATLTHPRTGAREQVDVTADALAGIVFFALYSPQVSALLPMVIEQAERNDFQSLLALGFIGEAAGDTIAAGMHFSVLCSEDAPRIKEPEIPAALTNSFLTRTILDSKIKPCQFWPRGEVAESYYEPVVSDVPTLILSGDLDPVTPPSWGDQVARHLKNSKHLIASGTGHGAIARGCIVKIMQQFSEDGSVSKLDAGCLKDMRRAPFFVTPAGPDPRNGAQSK